MTLPRVGVLDRIAAGPAWAEVARTYGVDNPLPPWKTSLDGMCDALDRSGRGVSPLERRAEEDELSRTRYAHVPFPERQLLALTHSLVARGVISEDELAQRLEVVRTRLEAE
jgi:hypothetical protein